MTLELLLLTAYKTPFGIHKGIDMGFNMLALTESGLFAPHLSGAAGQRCHMELVSIPASKMKEAWDTVCVFWKEGVVRVCVCVTEHSFVQVKHTSGVYHCLWSSTPSFFLPLTVFE